MAGRDATPPPRRGLTTPPRNHFAGPGDLFLEEHELLVLYMPNGNEFRLDGKTRRLEGLTSTSKTCAFIAWRLGLQTRQICLLEG